MIVWMLAVAAQGEEPARWKDHDIERRVLTDVTAYTVGAKRWRVGLQRQQYGILENWSVGTTTLFWLLRAPNLNTKVTAIQTRNVDVSLEAEYISYNAQALLNAPATLRVTPIKGTVSWTPHRRWGLHMGYGALVASLDGQVKGKQIAKTLEPIIGVDLSESLDLEGSGVYAGANLTLQNLRLAFEYRMNRRDSLVFSSNNYIVLNGLVAAGAQLDDVGQGAEAQVGASARVRVPLAASVPTLNALSWQWSWPKFHLRLGIPFPNIGNGLAYVDAITFYWVLGKGNDERFGSELDRMSKRKRRKQGQQE